MISPSFLILVSAAMQAQEPSSPRAASSQKSEELAETSWPSFRGRNARGVAEGFSTPLHWDVEKGENIAWRTEIPGLAHSSPVIWGERIFVTTAVKEGTAELIVGRYGSVTSLEDRSPHEYQLWCIDRNDGEVLWKRTAWKGVPAIKRHPKSSHAAPTPATDGERVVAFFGSEGLYAYDMEGALLWNKDFGVLDSSWYVAPKAQWGFASSPVIHEGSVLVQCDVLGDSFVASLEAATGKELWRTARDEVPTWSTPTVHIGKDRRQVILNGYKHIGGYDLETGRELWKTGRGGDIPVPTPVVAKGLVLITNGHGRLSPIFAISAAAAGEFSVDPEESEHMVWAWKRRGNYMQTPLVYGDELYCCNDGGVLTCIDLQSGKRIYRKRLGDGRTGFTASGVAADGKLYFTSEIGEVHVIEAGRTRPDKILAVNDMGETCMATPAISRGTLFFRTRSHLVAVAGVK
ncbi:MAG: PQQ-binding-like beta-propeller repeat protein [Planctomycetota bacterium]